MRPRKPRAAKRLTCKGIAKVVDEHQKAIYAERHKVQEKDTQIALLCDDLTYSQQTVVELQAEVKRLTQQPHLEDPSKDNRMVIIEKNDSDQYPYLAICGQQSYVAPKIQNKMVDYPFKGGDKNPTF